MQNYQQMSTTVNTDNNVCNVKRETTQLCR